MAKFPDAALIVPRLALVYLKFYNSIVRLTIEFSPEVCWLYGDPDSLNKDWAEISSIPSAQALEF